MKQKQQEIVLWYDDITKEDGIQNNARLTHSPFVDYTMQREEFHTLESPFFITTSQINKAVPYQHMANLVNTHNERPKPKEDEPNPDNKGSFKGTVDKITGVEVEVRNDDVYFHNPDDTNFRIIMDSDKNNDATLYFQNHINGTSSNDTLYLGLDKANCLYVNTTNASYINMANIYIQGGQNAVYLTGETKTIYMDGTVWYKVEPPKDSSGNPIGDNYYFQFHTLNIAMEDWRTNTLYGSKTDDTVVIDNTGSIKGSVWGFHEILFGNGKNTVYMTSSAIGALTNGMFIKGGAGASYDSPDTIHIEDGASFIFIANANQGGANSITLWQMQSIYLGGLNDTVYVRQLPNANQSTTIYGIKDDIANNTVYIDTGATQAYVPLNGIKFRDVEHLWLQQNKANTVYLAELSGSADTMTVHASSDYTNTLIFDNYTNRTMDEMLLYFINFNEFRGNDNTNNKFLLKNIGEHDAITQEYSVYGGGNGRTTTNTLVLTGGDDVLYYWANADEKFEIYDENGVRFGLKFYNFQAVEMDNDINRDAGNDTVYIDDARIPANATGLLKSINMGANINTVYVAAETVVNLTNGESFIDIKNGSSGATTTFHWNLTAYADGNKAVTYGILKGVSDLETDKLYVLGADSKVMSIQPIDRATAYTNKYINIQHFANIYSGNTNDVFYGNYFWVNKESVNGSQGILTLRSYIEYSTFWDAGGGIDTYYGVFVELAPKKRDKSDIGTDIFHGSVAYDQIIQVNNVEYIYLNGVVNQQGTNLEATVGISSGFSNNATTVIEADKNNIHKYEVINYAGDSNIIIGQSSQWGSYAQIATGDSNPIIAKDFGRLELGTGSHTVVLQNMPTHYLFITDEYITDGQAGTVYLSGNGADYKISIEDGSMYQNKDSNSIDTYNIKWMSLGHGNNHVDFYRHNQYSAWNYNLDGGAGIDTFAVHGDFSDGLADNWKNGANKLVGFEILDFTNMKNTLSSTKTTTLNAYDLSELMRANTTDAQGVSLTLKLSNANLTNNVSGDYLYVDSHGNQIHLENYNGYIISQWAHNSRYDIYEVYDPVTDMIKRIQINF